VEATVPVGVELTPLVPGSPVHSAGSEALTELVGAGGCVVLSGAGLSTESGIPDYRGPSGAQRKAQPMTYQEFLGSAQARQRYWARSYAGWPFISSVRPNAGHRAVARLAHHGLIDAVITQNVDGLHHAAGSDPVVELHGALARVACLNCRAISDREQLQQRLAQANPGFDVSLFADPDGDTAAVRPDGDLDVAAAMVENFHPVPCLSCGTGPLKPDVVFFGENVPKDRVAHCFDLVDAAQTLLVLGSSLTVMSGYRFVRHATKRGITVAIVNAGPTRGDSQADLRIDAPLGAVLSATVKQLPRRDHGSGTAGDRC
jgi:NAD-dependent SIR2 family protein deacetylase